MTSGVDARGSAALLGAGLGFFALASCASISRAPDRAELTELLMIEHTCKAEDGKACKPEEQPKKIVVDSVTCRSLPLRAGVPEVSRAECSYSAKIYRTDGQETVLGPRTAEFGLLNYSPGARIGVFQWSKKPDKNAPPEAAPGR